MPVYGVIPQLRTTNLADSIDFYVSKLGFALEFQYSDFYAGIKVGQQSFHLKLVDSQYIAHDEIVGPRIAELVSTLS